MFVSTNTISNVIIYLDSLLSINGTRITNTMFPVQVTKSDSVMLDIEIALILSFIHRHFNYVVISNHKKQDLDLILRKIKPYIKFKTCISRIQDSLDVGAHRLIKETMEFKGYKPCETVFFSGDADTILEALNLQLGTICWAEVNRHRQTIFETGPDFVVANAKKTAEILTWKKLGNCSEVSASPPDLFPYKKPEPNLQILPLNNDERAGEYIFVGGRYFKTGDPRFQRHALSLRIINSKKHMSRQIRFFSVMFASLIGTISRQTGYRPDLITRVPPKPGQPDRLADLLQTIVKIPDINMRPEQGRADILQCIRDYDSQKSMGYTQRRDNVRGVFAAAKLVAGKTVYVLDDVVTSGATMKEACKMLYQAKAKKVIPVALAYHPRNLRGEAPLIPCKKCGGVLVGRFTKEGKLFYGCSNFLSKKCENLTDFVSTVQQTNMNIGF